MHYILVIYRVKLERFIDTITLTMQYLIQSNSYKPFRFKMYVGLKNTTQNDSKIGVIQRPQINEKYFAILCRNTQKYI